MESVDIRKRTNSGGAALAAIIMMASVALAVFHGIRGDVSIYIDAPAVKYLITALAVAVGILIMIVTIRNKNFIAAAAQLIQLGVLAVFQISKGVSLDGLATITVDSLATVIILVTGLMGGILIWRTGSNASLIAALLAVDGMAISDDMVWMYLFWLVIAISSYNLIAGEHSSSIESARRMLTVNACGGISFVVGIVISGIIFETIDVTSINLIETVYSDLVAVPAIFLVLAGLIRSVQVPFNAWTRKDRKHSGSVGAVIQSLALANSGIVLLIKMAPAMGISNFAGLMAIIVGGVTFFLSSVNAITDVDIRKMLADATSSIMGLIVVCTGIGTSESVWAAIMLLVFHTVAMPILLAGTEEDKLRTDVVMATVAMMVAPFALVLLQKEALGSIADTGNILLMLIICFSGAIAIFYWTRWLGTMMSDAITEGIESINLKEMNPMKANAWLLIILILTLPIFSMYMVVPYMEGIFGGMSTAANLTDNIIDTAIIALAVALAAYPVYKGIQPEKQLIVSEDAGEENEKEVHEILRKSPVTSKIQLICSIVAIGIIVMCFGFITVSLIGLLGGVM